MSLNETYGRYFTLPDVKAERDERVAFAQDCGRFIGTKSYQMLRDGLDMLIRDAKWEPGMTSETAAQLLIEQSAYRKITDLLDKMVMIAKEKLDGGQG